MVRVIDYYLFYLQYTPNKKTTDLTLLDSKVVSIELIRLNAAISTKYDFTKYLLNPHQIFLKRILIEDES